MKIFIKDISKKQLNKRFVKEFIIKEKLDNNKFTYNINKLISMIKSYRLITIGKFGVIVSYKPLYENDEKIFKLVKINNFFDYNKFIKERDLLKFKSKVLIEEDNNIIKKSIDNEYVLFHNNNKILNFLNKSLNIKLLKSYSNRSLFGLFSMKKLDMIFTKLFDQDKMLYIIEVRPIEYYKFILNEFNHVLRLYIGGLEELLSLGIYHNDAHDANFGFMNDGSIKFIDLGEAVLFDKNCSNYQKLQYLKEDVEYFKNMYFFDEQNYIPEDYLYDLYKKSYIKEFLDQVENEEYKFNSNKIYLEKNNYKVKNIDKIKKTFDNININI